MKFPVSVKQKSLPLPSWAGHPFVYLKPCVILTDIEIFIGFPDDPPHQEYNHERKYSRFR
jgi:hypothetical protein